MNAPRRWWMRLRGLFGRERAEREFAAELASHIEMHIEDGVRAGLTAEEARRQALLKLGGVAAAEEMYREQRGLPVLENFGRDMAYSLRVLGKSPSFTAVAVCSLALGIGANTAMFSLVNAVLLRPLPYPAADRLMHSARDMMYAEYEALRQQTAVFRDVAGQQIYRERRFDSGERQEWASVSGITAGYFRTLGVGLWKGEEFQESSAERSVVLSYEFCQRAMQGCGDVVGEVISLDGVSHTVTGVAAENLWLPEKADVFVPLRATGGWGDLGANTQVIARLAAQVDARQKDVAAEAAGAIFRRQYPEYAREYRGFVLLPFQQWLAGDVRTKLLLLLGAVGLVLLIACFNLVGLLLARLSARRREISVRLALGSGRGRLVQQFLIENLMVCAMGGMAGVLGAYWLLDWFLAILPFPLKVSSAVNVDLPVLLFAMSITLLAAVVVTLVPAWMFSRADIQSALRQTARGAGERTRLRSALVVCEVAGAATLLVGAALVLDSLYRLNRQPLGFAPEKLLTFFTPPERGLDAARVYARMETLHEELGKLPGVRRVAAVNVLPLVGKNNFPAQRAGHPEQSIGGMEIRIVTPDYFETMGTALRSGRGFDARDVEGAVAVVLINEALAREWWPQRSPLGDRIEVGYFKGKPLMPEARREVIGVVADMKTVLLSEPARPTLFLPAAQARWYDSGMNWAIRVDADAGLAEAVRRKVLEIAPGQRVERMQTMERILADRTATPRFDAVIFGSFAFAAVLLAMIGVYGVLAFSVARRTQEIGTRMALGAQPGEVLRMVLGQGLQLVGLGLAIGLPGAVMLSRYLSKAVPGMPAAEPLGFAVVAGVLGLAGFVASYLPARRAMGVDPLAALRCE